MSGMAAGLGLNRKLVRAIYPTVDWDEYDREVVAESLPDYEELRDAAELLAVATRRYFEGETKAVVNIQPITERTEAVLRRLRGKS